MERAGAHPLTMTTRVVARKPAAATAAVEGMPILPSYVSATLRGKLAPADA